MWPLTNQRMPHAPAKRANFTELWFADTERELGLLARPSDLFFKEKPKKKTKTKNTDFSETYFNFSMYITFFQALCRSKKIQPWASVYSSALILSEIGDKVGLV